MALFQDDFFKTWVGVRIAPYGQFENYAFIVDGGVLIQEANTCWLYAFSRALNSMLRISGLIHDHSVDVLSFFVILHRWVRFLPNDMHIPNVNWARTTLVHTGLPLDGRVPFPAAPGPPPRFGVTSMNIFSLRQYGSVRLFETALVKMSKIYPVVVGIYPFPSFYQHNGNGLYRPTPNELNCTWEMSHLMLVTGDGKWGMKTFVQIQDTTRFHNDGFIYMELGVGSILYFVVLAGPRRVV